MNKQQSTGIWLVVFILVLALASMLFAGPTTATKSLTYTEFLNKIKGAEIKEVIIDNDTVTAIPFDDSVKSELSGKELNTASLRYRVNIPVSNSPIYSILDENNVNYEIKNTGENSSVIGLMGTALPIILIIISCVFYCFNTCSHFCCFYCSVLDYCIFYYIGKNYSSRRFSSFIIR